MTKKARVAKSVDASDLNPGDVSRAGSIPATSTNLKALREALTKLYYPGKPMDLEKHTEILAHK